MEQLLNDKKLEIQTQFDEVTKQIETKKEELTNLESDQLRLQGAYRVVNQMIEKVNEATPVVEAEVVKKRSKK